MEPNLTTIERAFQLAKARQCKTIEELRKVLRAEGYSPNLLVGPALTKQLRDLMRGASATPPARPRGPARPGAGRNETAGKLSP